MTTDNYRKHTSKNPLQKKLIENFFRTLVSTIQDLKIEKILDAGCGEGFTLNMLAQKKIGRHLEGVDFLKTAIELGKKDHPNLILKQASIYELPYKDNSFDLVMCTEVLEHLDNPQKALQELVRVSKKYVLLSVPNEPIFMASNFLRGKNISRFGNDIEHINHWSTFSFEKFVKEEKVKVIQKRHPFPWTMILAQKE